MWQWFLCDQDWHIYQVWVYTSCLRWLSQHYYLRAHAMPNLLWNTVPHQGADFTAKEVQQWTQGPLWFAPPGHKFSSFPQSSSLGLSMVLTIQPSPRTVILLSGHFSLPPKWMPCPLGGFPLTTNFLSFFLSFFKFFWLHWAAWGILGPRPGIEPVLPAVEAWSHNHWTARELPHH